MAKKDKDTIFKEYLAELEAINPAIKDVLADEKVSAKLREGVLARSDYSASMDSLKAEREQFATEVAEARQKIEGWQKWYGDTSQAVVTIQDKLKAYEEAYGQLDPADTKRAAKSMGISKEELDNAVESRMDKRDLAALKFADDLTDVKIDFRDRFKEKLDTQAVFKIAGERQCDLPTAYNYFIADRLEEQRTSRHKEEIEQAKKDAVAEFATQHRMPVAPTSSDSFTHVLDAKNVGTTSRDRVAAALAGLNDSRSSR